MKKSVIVGISILSVFILCSLSYQPIIAEEPIENIVETSIEFCGFNKLETYKINITRDEIDELELIFQDIQRNLNETLNIEEKKKIIKDALNDFKNIGLLDEKSEKKANELFSKIDTIQSMNTFDREKPIFSNDYNVTDNRWCLAVGNVGFAMFIPPITSIFYMGAIPGIYYLVRPKLCELGWIVLLLLFDILDFFYLGSFYYILLWMSLIFPGLMFGTFINPLLVGHLVDFGMIAGGTYGWIKTIGPYGHQSIEGWLNGIMLEFTGIKIYIPAKGFYFFGFTTWIILATE